MHRTVLCLSFLLLVPSVLQAQAVSKAASPQQPLPPLEHFDPKLVDTSVDPCNNFYRYACGKILASSPVPADEIYWGPFGKIAKWNAGVLREALDQAAAQKEDRSPSDQKIGDYYTACMNESKLQADGVKPIQPLLDRISAMKSTSELAAVIAQLHRDFPASWQGGDNQTNTALLGFGPTPDYNDARMVVAGIDQGGLSLPGRDFYLNTDEKSASIRKQYLAHVAKMFQISGDSPAAAQQDASSVLGLETELAKVQMDNIARRDPKNLNNRMSLAQVKALTPSFDWDTYFSTVGAPPSSLYLVTSPAFFRGAEPLIQHQPLDAWKAYLRYQTLSKAARYLGPSFEDEDFAFYDKVLYGTQEKLPRWRRCVNYTDRDLGEALGKAYVARAFPPESKQRSQQLVNDIEAALYRDITSVTWMQPSTKQAAHVKLAAVVDKIGYPDHWRDYSALTITPDSLMANVQRLRPIRTSPPAQQDRQAPRPL